MTIKAHVKKHGYRIVTPTVPLVRYWWARVNRELWDGVLPSPGSIDIQRDKVAWAWTLMPDIEPRTYHLKIDSYPLTKKRLLQVLAHESVHAYLWIIEGDSATDHGKPFMRYRYRMKKRLGLNLTRRIDV